MNGMTRWTPARPLDRLFDEFFTGLRPAGHEDMSVTRWTPAADIKETEDALFVCVDLPGLLKEDIDISLESGVLTVSGERRFTKDDSKETYHRLERFRGQFQRSFRLPRNIDRGEVKASFIDGLLTLELPKTEDAKPRQIEIN